MWVDTHAHLDAAEFDADRTDVHRRTRAAGVVSCVIPAIEAANFDTVRLLAHAQQDAYALGIHPLYTPRPLRHIWPNSMRLCTPTAMIHA